MGQLVVSVVGGLLLGGTYALIGLGLVQVFRATGTFNFAHGQMAIIPAFLFAAWEGGSGPSVWLAIVLTIVFGAVLGVLMFTVVLRRTIGQPHFMGFAATLGAGVVLDGIMQMAFGTSTETLVLPGVPTGQTTILGVGISTPTIYLGGFAIVLSVAVALYMRYTRTGTRIRAAGQDALLASYGGINVRRLFLVSWALAGALAAVAGLVYGSSTAFQISASSIALMAAPAIVLGGLDSFTGAIVGGLVIGLVQSFTSSYLGGTYETLVTYTILLLVLLAYPAGLFGTRAVSRL